MMAAMRRPSPEPAIASPTLRAVRAGDEITVQVLGGFARRRAPSDGVMVQMDDRDVFVTADKQIELPVMGTFEVSGGKIAAWRDYFDMNQFMSQLTG